MNSTRFSGSGSSSRICSGSSVKGFLFPIFALLLAGFFASSADAQVVPPTRGGLGTSTPPTYGQIPVGNANGTYTLTSTSSLGITGSGGAGTPGGSDTQIQFNDGGSFGGDAALTYSKLLDRLSVSYASTTAQTISGSLYLGSLTGVLQAIGGLVSATSTISQAFIDSAIARDSELHDEVTLAGTPDYITIANQVITRGLIDLTTDVTGVLPDGNVADTITLTNLTQITNRAISDTTGTLTVSRGGTGATTLSSGQLLYGAGTGAVQTVATTTLSASSPLSLSANTVVIGSSPITLSISTAGTWSGNAGTASALAANGSNCSAGQFPLGVSAAGAAESCTDAWTEAENTAAAYVSTVGVNSFIHGSTTIPKTYTSNTFGGTQTFSNTISGSVSGTASALSANGTNASAGNAIVGVDASGNAEGAFDVWTEAENTAAGYQTQAEVNAFIHGSSTIPKTYSANTFTNTGTTSFAGGLTASRLDASATSTFDGLVVATGGLKVSTLVSCNTVDTDASGNFICGSDATGGVGGGASSIATSSPETSGQVPYWTSTGGTPATLGSDSGLAFDAATDVLSVGGWAIATSSVVCAVGCEFTSIPTALASLPSGGGEVRLKNETYTLSSPLLIDKSRVSIVGEGRSTVIAFNASTTPVGITNSDYDTQLNWINLENFVISQIGAAGYGTCIDYTEMANSTFTNVDCLNANIGYIASTTNTHYNTIISPTITVSGAGARGFSVENNAIFQTLINARINPGTQGTGIYVDAHAFHCESCEVETNALIGVDVGSNGHDAELDVYLEGNATNLRLASGVENVRVTGFIADADTVAQNIVDNGVLGLSVDARVQYEPKNYITGNNFGLGTTTPSKLLSVAGSSIFAIGDMTIDGSDILLRGTAADIRSDTDLDLYPDNQTTRALRIDDATTRIDLSALGGNLGIADIIEQTASGTSTFASSLDSAADIEADQFFGTGSGTSTFTGGIRAPIFNATSNTASSTFANGINLTAGCFAVSGSCLLVNKDHHSFPNWASTTPMMRSSIYASAASSTMEWCPARSGTIIGIRGKVRTGTSLLFAFSAAGTATSTASLTTTNGLTTFSSNNTFTKGSCHFIELGSGSGNPDDASFSLDVTYTN